MQDKSFFPVVVPLDNLACRMTDDKGAQNMICMSAWARAAKHMAPMLGSVCRKIAPAVFPWDLPKMLRFGTVLGAVDPEMFLWCYLQGREQQEREIARRTRKIKDCASVLFSEDIGKDLHISIQRFQTTDPRLMQEMEFGNRFFSGDITAAAGLYYLGIDQNYIDERRERKLLANKAAYAICVAELTPMEGGQ